MISNIAPMRIGNSGIKIRRGAAACVLLAGAVMLTCCDRSGNSSPRPPRRTAGAKRVVSFSPAITQMMFDMGLGDRVVGVTRLCELPPGLQRPRVGDALSFNSEAILAVRPDIIFTQVDAAKFQGVRDIDGHVKVMYLSIESQDDIPAAMLTIGKELGCGRIARDKAEAFCQAIEAVEYRVRLLPRKRTVFVMGTDRPTVAGAGTFVADMISSAGGTNVGAAIPGQAIWRPTQIEAIMKVRPDVLICQVAPGKEDAARAYWMQWKDIPAAASGQVYVVSAAGWSIPGTHLAKLLPKMVAMIHGELPAPGATTMPAGATAEGRSP
ncbi:MAG: ABC transporter substrate-binding protein [Planctomycetes bacterium]|nr:ABC transporter substrate-binding protein [Planctomycetota bacterium]